MHRVIEVDDDEDLIDVECIKEPEGGPYPDGTPYEPWIRLGEQECNFARRYEFAGQLVDGATIQRDLGDREQTLLPPPNAR